MSLENLKKKISEKTTIIIGLERVKKRIAKKTITEVFMASNCKEADKIKELCKENKLALEELEIANKELGVICKKPYSISILGFEKK